MSAFTVTVNVLSSINVSFPDMNSKNNYYCKKNILNHSWWCDRVIINVVNKKK